MEEFEEIIHGDSSYNNLDFEHNFFFSQNLLLVLTSVLRVFSWFFHEGLFSFDLFWSKTTAVDVRVQQILLIE